MNTDTRALRVVGLTVLAMCAFAGNSLLCRLALRTTTIDAGSFTSIRLLCGALTLCLLARRASAARQGRGDWISAVALFAYAAGFSFAYMSLTAATGALLLFGAVQVTMIAWGLYRGERLHGWQTVGLVLALTGLLGLLAPGLTAPPPGGAALMLVAGVAWGVYSLRGRGAGDPLRVSAGNFLRTVPITLALSLVTREHLALDLPGVLYAASSGALTSGIGYVLWYACLPSLSPTRAASVQLSVPVLAALGGALFLGETPSLRLALSAVTVLGGVALVIAQRPGATAPGR